ncbi:MAG: hypothetical protein SGI92_23430 [Bryobacteraceae bacterium]|nr:hypothetical protein [Bryobacteraceae bacterium]
MISGQTRAILWVQWRSLMNFGFRRGGVSNIFTGIFMLLWYGIWGFFAWALSVAAADPQALRITLAPELASGLLLMILYWQIVPVLMASSGLSLDLSRLLIYPIPHAQLFRMELLLRMSTAVEMLLISAGLFVGLMRNPTVPKWAPLFLFGFVLFNVLLSAGIRDLLVRLMARRGIREVMVFLLVLITVLPQALMMTQPRGSMLTAFRIGKASWLPWMATARLITGHFEVVALASLAVTTMLAAWFARAQFERSLRFDVAAAGTSTAAQRGSKLEVFYRLPDRFLPDPLGALVSKELRFLSRAPRFRLLLLMGCSFGLIIWLPLLMRTGAPGAMRSNYLTIVSTYSLMLLGEVLFWNQLGMDRAAAQTYFVTPVRFATVLFAKNIVAVFFIVLELSFVAVACLLLRLPLTAREASEAFGVTAVLTVMLLGAGNMMSARYPRPVDPAKSWRNSAGRSQAWLLALYPVLSVPVLLAYGARYAFASDLAFWCVIGVDLLLAAVFYWVALESAAETAVDRREEIVQLLSNAQTPVAG